jgi:hypothetical protein
MGYTTHHDLEKSVVHILNLDNWELEWCGDEMTHYDAFGKTPKGLDCVIEFKFRKTYYETKILEKFKYDKLMKDERLKFYYVFDTKGNYLYWLDKLILKDVEIVKCKATSHFSDSYLMNKPMYMLTESQAVIINRY